MWSFQMWLNIVNIRFVIVIATSLLMFSCSTPRNNHNNAKSTLKGKVSKQIWIDSTNTKHLFSDYQPDKNKISRLSDIISNNDYNFVVFAGADCEDCHEYLPALFKLFDESGIDEGKYDIFVLDNKLEEPGGSHNDFDIPTTPTVFILNGKDQIGMITYPYYDWLNQIISILEEDIDED